MLKPVRSESGLSAVSYGRRTASSVSASLSVAGAYGSSKSQTNVFVVEIGNRLTRAGLVGEHAPREVFRTVFIDPTRPAVQHAVYDPSRDAQEQERILTAYFKEITTQRLLRSPINARFILVESFFSTTAFRDTCAKVLFSNPSLKASAISFIPAPLMNMITLNAKTALLVDTGINETTLYPVFERVVLFHEFDATPCSTALVEARVRELMTEHGRVQAFDGTERDLNEEDLRLFDRLRYAEDICYRFCFATTRERSLASKGNADFKYAPAVKLPFGTEMLIIPGIVRETAAEVVFTHDQDTRSIPQLIVDFIHRASIEVKRKYLKSLMFVGGLSHMKGFLARIREEIGFLLEDDYDGRYVNMKSDIGFYTFSDEAAIKLSTAWLGASLVGAAEINPWYTRDQWLSDPHIPDWTTDIESHLSKLEEENFHVYEEQPALARY